MDFSDTATELANESPSKWRGTEPLDGGGVFSFGDALLRVHGDHGLEQSGRRYRCRLRSLRPRL
jgi:hypothetical protein